MAETPVDAGSMFTYVYMQLLGYSYVSKMIVFHPK